MASSPGYFEKKSDISELKSKLINACLKKDTKACRVILKKVIAFMTLGIDVSALFPEIIKASATNDIVQKKLAYLYFCNCAESNSELALLIINTLVKDAQHDANPMVRGLSLRSMFNIRIQSLVQYMKDSLLSGLNDSSAYVRRNAVIACVKLFKLAPDIFEDMNLIDKLHGMIQDRDNQVSINAFISLDEILSSSGGVKLDRNFLSYLLNRLRSYNEWSQCMVLHKIVAYETEDEEEILEYLNILDERLKHANKGVVLATINVFLQFTKRLEFLKLHVLERIKAPILSMLPSPSPEIVYSVLNHVAVLIQMKSRLFHKDYKFFFLRNNEPAYVRHKKLDVLTDMVTEGNLQDIIDELSFYIRDVDLSISCQTINCIGKIALNNTIAVETCVKTLMDVLTLEVDYLTANCLQTLQELMVTYTSVAMQLLPQLDICWEQVQEHASGKAAIVWIYGEYGQDIPASPYHLEELIDKIEEEQSAVVKLNLLTAMMKLFLKRPPECQHALGRLLQYCIDEESNMDIRDRALFYYRLLQNIEQAKLIVLRSDPAIPTTGTNKNDSFSYEDFHFKEFNTLSIIYDQPPCQFILKVNNSISYDDDDDSTDDYSYAQASSEEEYRQRSTNNSQHSGTVPTHNNMQAGVVEGTLLELEEEPSLRLVESFIIEKDEYQHQWRSFSHSSQFQEDFTVFPEHEEILTVMRNACIQFRASSPPHMPEWKFFFYAKPVDEDAVVLIQLVVSKSENQMTVQTKSNSSKLLETFDEFYKSLFIGKWIACI